MKKPLLFLCLFLLIFVLGTSQSGQAAHKSKDKFDNRVRLALDELGLAYEITGQYDFKLKPVATLGNRTQLIYIHSQTQHYGRLEIREVIAPSYLSQAALSATMANRLLRENGEVKWGAWRAVAIDEGVNAGKYLILYAIQISADSDAESLRLAIKNAARTADELENEMTGRDDY